MVSFSITLMTLVLSVLIMSSDNQSLGNGDVNFMTKNTTTTPTSSRSSRDLVMTRGGSSIEITEVSRHCTISETDEEINDLTLMGSTHVECSQVTNLTKSLEQIPQNMDSVITSISISNSIVTSLDLTQFQRFSTLRHLSVTKSNISFLSGVIPFSLKILDVSHNNLRTMNITWERGDKSDKNIATTEGYTSYTHNFNDDDENEETLSWVSYSEVNISPTSSPTIGEESGESSDNESLLINGDNGDTEGNYTKTGGENIVIDTTTNERRRKYQLQVIDLSHNKISELPKYIFYLGGPPLSLRLSGNHLKCEFVWEKLWTWTKKVDGNEPLILSDADETFCGVDEGVRVFQYTVKGVLQAREDLEKTCSTVDKSLCSGCSLYALQKGEGHLPITQPDSGGEGNARNKNKGQADHPEKGSNGNDARISISLKLNCTSKNLTKLPPVPPQTWLLNISDNKISDLTPLKLPMYANLLILDAQNNQVDLETLTEEAPFMEKYNYLNLKNNGFNTIPANILISLRTMRGQGVTLLGENSITCDCNFIKEIKPLLIENSKRIRDVKDIFCRDGEDETTLLSKKRVKDLQYSDVCHSDSGDDANITSELSLVLIILAEVVLIVLIIGKVWHDQRNFRRTGHLPWCSSKMPRLPCDAMLESIKEGPNFNNRQNGSGSAASSNTNVHNVVNLATTPRVQLVGGVGSNSDMSSGRSMQPHFSGQNSSRTSSV